MRFPRITLRRMMIVVAIAALGLGLEMGRRRREGFLVLQANHARSMTHHLQMSEEMASLAKQQRRQAEKIRAGFLFYWPKAVVLDGMAGFLEDKAKLYREIADHHARMRDKFRNAARFPFVPVESDPMAPSDPDEY